MSRKPIGAKQKTQNNKSNVICGECICPIPDCPWMASDKPVPEWEAEIDTLKFMSGYVRTYSIKSCPLFKPHPRSVLFDSEGRKLRDWF